MSANYALLEQEALLHFTGPDSLTFLQGQTTCDTRAVDSRHSLPGAYCTPQGRMVCDFLLLELAGEHHALRLRADTLAVAASTFGKYIVFSRAELDAARSDWQVVACWGDGVAAALSALDITLPGGRYETVQGDGYVLVQVDEVGEQFEAIIDMQRHRDHYEALAGALRAGSEEEWQALQISAGIGRVEGATSGEFLPQTLNYDITGFVSFNKGCYTGQEIVARLHYRGKAKRRMHLARLAGETPLAPGTDLVSADSGKAAGTVVNSAASGGETLCLVSATEAGIAAGLAVAGSNQPLEIAALPYDLGE